MISDRLLGNLQVTDGFRSLWKGEFYGGGIGPAFVFFKVVDMPSRRNDRSDFDGPDAILHFGSRGAPSNALGRKGKAADTNGGKQKEEFFHISRQFPAKIASIVL